jgi:SAM-dependent methyltransferase
MAELPPHPSGIDALLARQAERAGAMADDAQRYWQRHAPRFEYLLRYLRALPEAATIRRVLDVGASFEPPLLAEAFPAWQIDVLAEGRDERFALPPPSRQFIFDLNLAATAAQWPAFGVRYDLIVFMEVIEHLTVAPDAVLRFLDAQLADGGAILLTTPNAAWLKNRLKLLRGQNPFERLRAGGGGHIREYTLGEMREIAAVAGLRCEDAQCCGLYGFGGAIDRFYNALANATLPGLRRTLVLLLRKPPAGSQV